MAVFFRIESIAWRICMAAAAIVIGGGAPLAQSVVVPPDTAKELLQEAFDSPFGRMMINEFNVRMGDGADRTCLRDKPRTVGEHLAQGEGFLRAWGLWALEQFYARAGNKAYNAAIEDALAPNAPDKLKRLLSAPEVIRYRAIERRARLAEALYFVLETFDRFVVIEQLKMKPVSPLFTGVPELLDASGIDKVADELYEFQQANKSEALEQYVELTSKAEKALREALEAAEVRADILLKTADQDLGRLCVLRKTPK